MPQDLLEAQEFAQSKAQAQKRGKTGIKFADVAGADSTLRELQEVVEVSRLSFVVIHHHEQTSVGVVC